MIGSGADFAGGVLLVVWSLATDTAATTTTVRAALLITTLLFPPSPAHLCILEDLTLAPRKFPREEICDGASATRPRLVALAPGCLVSA